MSNQWLHLHQQNHLSNTQLPFHLSDHDHITTNNNNNSDMVSDSTVVTTATTPPPSSGLNPDGTRVAKPVRKRSRASRRTPTTLLNTDAANFRAMVQQFTGGPSHANNNNFSTFGFPNNSQTLFDPVAAAAAYQLQDPPPQPTLYQFQNQPPPFMFSLSNSAAGEGFFQQLDGGGSRIKNNNNNNNYVGAFDGSSPTTQNSRPA